MLQSSYLDHSKEFLLDHLNLHALFYREISNNLKNLGLKIGDVKVISSPEILAEQKDFSDSNKDNSSQDLKNNKSDENKERKEDSQRRQNLWEFYRERMLS